jgi:hypothetical protein
MRFATWPSTARPMASSAIALAAASSGLAWNARRGTSRRIFAAISRARVCHEADRAAARVDHPRPLALRPQAKGFSAERGEGRQRCSPLMTASARCAGSFGGCARGNAAAGLRGRIETAGPLTCWAGQIRGCASTGVFAGRWGPNPAIATNASGR